MELGLGGPGGRTGRRLLAHLESDREIFFRRQSERGRLDFCGVESRVEEDREEGDGERHLNKDHRGPYPSESQTGSPYPRVAKARLHVAAGHFERGYDPRNGGAEYREQAHVEHGLRPEVDVQPEREIHLYGLEYAQAPPQSESCGRESEDRSDAPEHESFGEELHDDPAAARAQRAPHQDLALACGRPREYQRGDVGADEDQEHRRERMDRVRDTEDLPPR